MRRHAARLAHGALEVEAARRQHEQLRRRRRDGVPGRRERALARAPEHLLAARERDHLRHPVARRRTAGRATRRRTRAARGRPRTAWCTPSMRWCIAWASSSPVAGDAEVAGERADRFLDLAEVARVERERLDVDVGHAPHLAARHGADLAQILGHDQVGREALEQLGVDRVERPAVGERVAHRAVDLRARDRRGVDARGRDDREPPAPRPGSCIRASARPGCPASPSAAMISVALGTRETMRTQAA